MVLNALFIALHVVLCYVSINLGNMKITMSGLPIVIGSMLMGPMSGVTIGLVGSFLNQMLQYGFTATTVLWILPAGLKGLMCGWYARRKGYAPTHRETLFILILSAVLVTSLNTLVMYIDSKLYGYYSYAYVFGAIIPRYISGVITSFVYLIITETLLVRLRRMTNVKELQEV